MESRAFIVSSQVNTFKSLLYKLSLFQITNSSHAKEANLTFAKYGLNVKLTGTIIGIYYTQNSCVYVLLSCTLINHVIYNNRNSTKHAILELRKHNYSFV